MKKLKIQMIYFVILVTIVSFTHQVIASDNQNFEVKEVEYTNEYQNWLDLSEEEKSQTLQPRKYELETADDFLQTRNNPLKMRYLQGNSNLSQFSLKDILGENTQIKNQKNTELCWSFATLSALETNLALQDYKNGKPFQKYDFSEAHMAYGTVRNTFLNNQVNDKGLNRKLGGSGNFYVAQNYLTNGTGAVNETELSFENLGNNIDIAKIQNSNIITTLYDTVEFSATSEAEKTPLIQKMKSHISDYGGLYAGIYGANVFDSNYYNNTTGALYVANQSVQMDHAVTIIGWDDTYSKDNFSNAHKPKNNGAWLAKNSWGEAIRVTLDEAKKANFEANKEQYAQYGIHHFQDLPSDPFIQEFVKNGYTPSENNTVFTYPIGKNGYIYISYEDAVVYRSLWGIKKAKNEKDYTNLYQNDLLGYSQAVQLQADAEKVYLSNVFERDQSEAEKLDKISVYTLQNWKNCKVYVNPTGNNRAKENLQEVKIKDGKVASNSIDIEVGYHTIEFAEPISITGDYFAVVLQFETDTKAIIPIEAKVNNGFENAIVNSNESFFTIDEGFEQNTWQDFALLPNEATRGNVILKAFTQKSDETNNTQPIAPPPTEIDNNTNDKKMPKASNFEAASAFITNIKIDEQNDVSEMTIKVSGIKIGDKDNQYTYSYCILGTTDATQIKDNTWSEIPADNVKMEADGTCYLTFKVNLNEQVNLTDFRNADKIYLHVKEKAQNKNQQIETKHVLDIQYDIEQAEYPVEVANVKNVKDDTVANKILPKTGNMRILIGIMLVLGVGVFCYVRYRNIDR